MGNFFITGGEGLIGHNIAAMLSKEGHEVTVYDSNRSWKSDNNQLYHQYLIKRRETMGPDVQRVNGDTTDHILLRNTIEQVQPTHIIHLAALPLADESNKYGLESKKTILDATEILLQETLNYMKHTDSFQRFTYASSSMVYGDFATFSDGFPVPARESDRLNPKKSMYATYKNMGEILVRGFGHVHGVPFSIVRPSAVYGPTDANGRVSEIFVNNALTGKPLRAKNNGEARLDFTYVTDIARGFILAATHEKAHQETFNITAGNGRSLKELATIIGERLPGTDIRLEQETDAIRPNRGTLDITKARNLLGYEPEMQLEEGINKYIDYVIETGVLEGILEQYKKE